MTAIAFRDGIIAADSGEFDGEILTSVRAQKIFRRDDGAVAAASGDAVVANEFTRAFMRRDEDRFEWRGKSDDDFCRAIMVFPCSRKIWYITDMGKYELCAEFCAIGGAQSFLLGAMAAGATAAEAVGLAIQRHAFSAGDVQVVKVW